VQLVADQSAPTKQRMGRERGRAQHGRSRESGKGRRRDTCGRCASWRWFFRGCDHCEHARPAAAAEEFDFSELRFSEHVLTGAAFLGILWNRRSTDSSSALRYCRRFAGGSETDGTNDERRRCSRSTVRVQ
jgi:hypothetical protein